MATALAPVPSIGRWHLERLSVCEEDIMSEQVASSHGVLRIERRTGAEVKYEADPGPWLFFVAPVTFAATLLILSWLSLHSF
jgi:hypothetical protein